MRFQPRAEASAGRALIPARMTPAASMFASVWAEVIVKPELIGGARITVGDNVIDGTVQERLRAMAAQLRA